VSERNEYALRLVINGFRLNRVVIDQHYRVKHSESVNDVLILELLKDLDGGVFPIEAMRGDFQYFTVEPVFRENRPYRLILLLCIGESYLGVVNAFRVSRRPRK
jgi:hypothetical protein